MRRSPLDLFHPARTLSGSLCSPPSPRGEGFVRRYSFSTYACICSDDMGIALLSQTTHLRRSSRSFSSRFPIQPPPLRGTSFHRKEGVSTRAPSLGRGCRAQRGGVGFLWGRQSPLLFAFPIGERGPRQRRSGALVNGALEMHFHTLFHTARTLSGSLCSPPSPRGEGFVRRYSFSPRILYSL